MQGKFKRAKGVAALFALFVALVFGVAVYESLGGGAKVKSGLEQYLRLHGQGYDAASGEGIKVDSCQDGAYEQNGSELWLCVVEIGNRVTTYAVAWDKQAAMVDDASEKK